MHQSLAAFTFLAAAAGFMLSPAHAQAPLSSFKDCDHVPRWWSCRRAIS